MKKKKDEEPQFFTDLGVLIDQKKTKVFTTKEHGKSCIIDAFNYAKEVNTYHYQVFDHNNRHAGYGVPKR